MTDHTFFIRHLPVIIAGVIVLLIGGAVTTVLVNPSDPYFRWSTLAIPGVFFAAGLIIVFVGIRYRMHPVVRTDANAVYFGVLSTRSIPRNEIQKVVFDNRTMVFHLRQGQTTRFAPPARGIDLAEIARCLNSWAKG